VRGCGVCGIQSTPLAEQGLPAEQSLAGGCVLNSALLRAVTGRRWCFEFSAFGLKRPCCSPIHETRLLLLHLAAPAARGPSGGGVAGILAAHVSSAAKNTTAHRRMLLPLSPQPTCPEQQQAPPPRNQFLLVAAAALANPGTPLAPHVSCEQQQAPPPTGGCGCSCRSRASFPPKRPRGEAQCQG